MGLRQQPFFVGLIVCASQAIESLAWAGYNAQPVPDGESAFLCGIASDPLQAREIYVKFSLTESS
jgi:hypothetical protein